MYNINVIERGKQRNKLDWLQEEYKLIDNEKRWKGKTIDVNTGTIPANTNVPWKLNIDSVYPFNML